MLEKREREEGGKNKDDIQSSRIFTKEKKELFFVLEDSNISYIEKNERIKAYFQTILEPQEFEELQILVVDSDNSISWQELIQDWVVNIKNGKVEGICWKGSLDIDWTSIKSLRKIKKVWWDLDLRDLETLEDIWNLEEVWLNIYISWAKIKTLWKLKKVWWSFDCSNLEILEDLWKLEEIWWNLSIRWTRIRTLWKIKKVNWLLYCDGVETLEDLWDLEEVWDKLDLRWTNIKSLWKLKKVWWYLYLRWTNIKIQLEVIKKYQDNNLKIGKEIYFWWDIEVIEALLKQWKIPWILDIKNIDIEKQLEIGYKQAKWELNIKNIIINKILNQIRNDIYEGVEINYDKYREVFGNDINKIEDKEMKTIWEGILRWEYKKIKNEIEKKIKKIIEENDWKKLTEEEKRDIRKLILELDRELKRKREQIESFGIEL